MPDHQGDARRLTPLHVQLPSLRPFSCGPPSRVPMAPRTPTYGYLYEQGSTKTMNYTESRARYAEVLDPVINDREEVVITRTGHEPVVMVSLADFESLPETAYLMRSPPPRSHGTTRGRGRPNPGTGRHGRRLTRGKTGLGLQRLPGPPAVADHLGHHDPPCPTGRYSHLHRYCDSPSRDGVRHN